MTLLQNDLALDHPPARRFINRLSRSASDVLDHPVLRNHPVLLAVLSAMYRAEDRPTRPHLLARLNAASGRLEFKARAVVGQLRSA